MRVFRIYRDGLYIYRQGKDSVRDCERDMEEAANTSVLSYKYSGDEVLILQI